MVGQLQVELEKLSAADREFIKSAQAKPVAVAPRPPNPFVELKGAPKDPVLKSKVYLTELAKRVGAEIPRITGLDTQQKRNEAYQGMIDDINSDLRTHAITLRFTIEDVVERNYDRYSNTTISTLTVSDAEGSGSFDATPTSIDLAMKPGQAAKISKGDKLTISGKASFAANCGSPDMDSRGGIVAVYSDSSNTRYGIRLEDIRYYISPQRSTK